MQEDFAPAPEQKENARHGEQMFPLQKYVTDLNNHHPSVTAHWHEEAEFMLVTSGSGLKPIALLLPHCSEASKDTPLYAEHTAKLKSALEYIGAHYAEELSIPDLAKRSYFSEYHFMRFFKKYMGMSCVTYIKNLRLEKAVECFERGETSTLDISLSVGFHSLSYFHREFKSRYGITPKKFVAGLSMLTAAAPSSPGIPSVTPHTPF